MRRVPLAPDIDAAIIARGTPGFSGADLANLVNEAALFAARGNKRVVSMVEFEKAKDKIMMGAERRSMVMTEAQKESTAYHEAGHAIIGRLVPEHDPVHKVTIIPRGRATQSAPAVRNWKARFLRCTVVVWQKRSSMGRNMFLPVRPTILKLRPIWHVTW